MLENKANTTIKFAWATKRKILLLGVTFALVLGISTFVALYLQLSNPLDVLARVNDIRASYELEIGIRSARYRLLRYRLSGDEDFLEDIDEARDNAVTSLASLERPRLNPDDQQLFVKVASNYHTYFRQFQALLEKRPELSDDETFSRVSQLDNFIHRNVRPSLVAFRQFQSEELARTLKDATNVTNIIVFALLFGFAVSVLFGFGFGILLLRSFREKILQVEDKLRTSEAELRHQHQLASVGQLAAGIAHEIRGPITAIRQLVHSTIDSRGRGDSINHENLRVIDHEIARVESSLKSFLNFARPSEVDITETNLATVFEDVIRLTSGRIKQKKLNFAKFCEYNHIYALVDQRQIKQLMLNLVFNAIEELPECGKLWVSLTATNPKKVRFQVSDAGDGIASDIRDKIFDPFFSTKAGGSGLGLAVAKRIALAHKTIINVEPNYPRGTTFSFDLPAEIVTPTAKDKADKALHLKLVAGQRKPSDDYASFVD